MLWRFSENPSPHRAEVDALLDRWNQLETDATAATATCMMFLELALEECRDSDYHRAPTGYVGALSSRKAQDIISGLYDAQPAKYRVVKPGQAMQVAQLVRAVPELRREDAFLDCVLSLAEESDRTGRHLHKEDFLERCEGSNDQG
jgi:hypothetical protein